MRSSVPLADKYRYFVETTSDLSVEVTYLAKSTASLVSKMWA